MRSRESKKIIKMYNRVAKTLVAFEYVWYEAWVKSIDTSRAGLNATLIVRHPENNRLLVNFDPELLQLIREAKCLQRLGLQIPESARMVMLQETKYKQYYQQISHLLKRYEAIEEAINPTLAHVLEPHLRDLQLRLRPGMVRLSLPLFSLHCIHATPRRHCRLH